jgi:hypothetical protein
MAIAIVAGHLHNGTADRALMPPTACAVIPGAALRRKMTSTIAPSPDRLRSLQRHLDGHECRVRQPLPSPTMAREGH